MPVGRKSTDDSFSFATGGAEADGLRAVELAPERLAAIRNERKPGSRYASVDNCREEIHAAEQLLRHEGIPLLDTTAMSVEEIAITILHQTGLASRLQG